MRADLPADATPLTLTDAACRDLQGSLTGVYFSEDLSDIAAAQAICAGCPVRLECLEGAIARHEPWGVWGGQMFLDGRILASRRRKGRPSRQPRPGDVIPVSPVPAHLERFVRSA